MITYPSFLSSRISLLNGPRYVRLQHVGHIYCLNLRMAMNAAQCKNHNHIWNIPAWASESEHHPQASVGSCAVHREVNFWFKFRLPCLCLHFSSIPSLPPSQSFRFSSPLVLVTFSSEFHFCTVGRDPIIPVFVNLLETMLKSTLDFSLLLLGLLLNIKWDKPMAPYTKPEIKSKEHERLEMKGFFRGWRDGSLLKCSLCNHENLNLNSQHSHKMQIWWHHTYETPVLGE